MCADAFKREVVLGEKQRSMTTVTLSLETTPGAAEAKDGLPMPKNRS